MNTDFLGDLNDVDNPVRAAGRSACVALDLPISDAAFDLIDKLAEYMRDAVEECGGIGELEAVGLDSAVELAGDWMSGSGVISCYTSTQVHQWAELGAWQADLEDATAGMENRGITDMIGAELYWIAYTIARAMEKAICELAAESEDSID